MGIELPCSLYFFGKHMASTYLELTNRLLRRLNEVQIDPSNFDNTRGVQTMAKDAIQASVNEINEVEFEWPFNATTGSATLVIGQSLYNWPADLKTVDWNSFRIAKSSLLGTNTKRLNPITTDQWNQYFRDIDDDNASQGAGLPVYVFRQHSYGFGVSPSPDKAYTVNYDYWKVPVQLVAATDTTSIPTAHEEAIIQGGLYHFYMFRDNTEQSKEAQSKFKAHISRMRTLLVNPDDGVSGTMITGRYGPRTMAIPVGGWYF